MINIDKSKLKNYMKYIIKTYPKGCAIVNWNMYYSSILNNEREIEDHEISNIVKGSLDEFIFEDLDLCGCGNPEDTYEIIRLILTSQNKKTYKETLDILNGICNIDTDKNSNYNGLLQFVMYILDSHKFLEHGGCISSSWLTEKGKIFLDILNIQKELDEKE